MSPSFGDLQTVVLVIFVVIAAALVATFVVVARASREDIPADRVRENAYRLRRGWFAFLIVLLGGAVTASMLALPYSRSAEGGVRAEVRVSGGQFYWSLSPPTVVAGTEVRFDVTSVDVNHGFGIYDPDGELMGNVQAMPGYHNTLVLTLDKPGTYMVSCLEFCGIKHHEMTREFEVTP